MKTVLAEPLTISPEVLEELSKPLRENGNEFKAYDTKPQSTEEWLERIGDGEQLILANTKLPEEVIEKAPNLKYINVAFTGVDHVPVEAAKAKGIQVSNAAGYSDEGVAELVIGFAIAHLRKMREADLGIRKGMKGADFLGGEIAGRTVGIIGTGNIGKRTAELFTAFNAKVVATSRTEKEDLKKLGVTYVSLDELLETSDIVTLHLPQNANTKGFLGEDEFKKMKEGAIFINCARGPIIDNEALAKVLKEGKLLSAIDVFTQEPPLDESEALLHTPNTILTPHVAYFTVEAMEKRAKIVFENAKDYLEGKTVKTLI